MKPVLWAYVLAIVLAEAAGVALNAGLGVALHGLILLTLLVNYVWRTLAPYRRLLPVLMLIPLLRILSLSLLSPEVPPIYWFLLAGIPVLVSAALTAHLLQFSPRQLGLAIRFDLTQAGIALTGLPLAVAAYWLLRPAPLLTSLDWQGLLIGFLSLAVFAGFTEELIFRGLVLHTTREVFGRPAAIILSSLLFATVYVGSLSAGFLVLTGLVGVYFAYCVEKTGSLWGVTVAHSLMASGLILILPAVAGSLP
jgi:membrane protease YdiL (CAAX protease family)